MAKQEVPVYVQLRDVAYFIQKGETEKALQILQAMIKRYGPKIQDNDPAQ